MGTAQYRVQLRTPFQRRNTFRYSLTRNLQSRMSEAHLDEYDHYNFDQDKHVNMSGHSGKQRSKTEAAMNTNRPNPGGHERKIMAKLMNAEKNNQGRQDKS